MKITDIGDLHATDFPVQPEDKELGQELAAGIGDTFIDGERYTPAQQWTSIVRTLRVHGLRITN